MKLSEVNLLPYRFKKILEEEGYKELTDVQSETLPYILEGWNTLVIAPTGSGKTEAALIPVLHMASRLRNEKGILALYITPLRALNRDIMRRMKRLSGRLGLKLEVRHGDTPTKVRVKQVEDPPHILVTTPETLQVLLVAKSLRRHLEHVRWIIVDEIHEFAYSKRGVQLFLSLERVEALAGRRIQRIGLSATVDQPEYVAELLSGGRGFKIVDLGGRRSYIVQVLYLGEGEDQVERILELIKPYSSTLIFVNTREQAEILGFKLRASSPDTPVEVHHSSIAKDLRVRAEENLKSGRVKALICTSSLELGLDVGSVDYVIHYGSPRQTVRLIHRLGRSGHKADVASLGAIVALNIDDLLESAVIARRTLAHQVEPECKLYGAFDVLAHQIVGLTLEKGRIHLSEILNLARKCPLYRRLTVEDLADILSLLSRLRIVKQIASTVSLDRRAYKYYFENLSTIVEVSRFEVRDEEKRRIGSLDESFVEQYCKPGSSFVMAGEVWRVLGVDREKRTVYVKRDPYALEAVPVWEGEVIPVPFEVAQEVGRVKRLVEEALTSGRSPLRVLGRYPLTLEECRLIVEYVKKQIEEGFEVPSDRKLYLEGFEDNKTYYLVLHAHLGDRVNETLALLMAALLSAETGSIVDYRRSPYRIIFYSDRKARLDPERASAILRSLKPEDLGRLLETILPYKTYFLWRIWTVARRFGGVEKNAPYSIATARKLVEAFRDTPIYREAVSEVSREILDIPGCRAILEAISQGRLEVKVSSKPVGSPMAMSSRLTGKARTGEARIIDIVRSRIESTKVKLVCLGGADWEYVAKVAEIVEPVRCPRCGSARLAVTRTDDFQASTLARKALERKLKDKEELKRYRRYLKTAELIRLHGKRAVAALAGRGIGPSTAQRILRNYYRDEEEFYRALAEAEHNYIRTRPYWS